MKKCSKCKIEREISDFGKTKSTKDGLSCQCKLCSKDYYEKNKELIKDRSKNWRKNNKEYKKEIDKKWAEKNKEKKLENSKNWAEKNKEKRKEISKRYYENHKKECVERQKKYIYKRIKNDQLYRIKIEVRKIIWHALNKNNFTKKSRTYDILGCNYEEFKKHIEMQFENWMNWDNHGVYTGNYNETWQYDHIIPLCSATNENEILLLNHYSNFQPLCSKKNSEKRGYYE